MSQSSNLSQPIRIVGGGVGGLTAALCLAHAGFSAKVHEQAERFDEVGAGIQLAPNSLSVLFKLGLRQALLPHIVAPERINLINGRSDRLINHVPLGEPAMKAFGHPYWLIHRADLHHVLHDACDKADGISIHLNSQLEPPTLDTMTIASDGVNSRWRDLVRGASEADFSGSVAWRATLSVTTQEPDANVWFGPDAHLVEYPIRGGNERNLVAITRGENQSALMRGFQSWHPSIKRRLQSIDDWTPWPIKTVVPEPDWIGPHVALLGDAAHGMVPFAAQGAAMAIEDAWVLATCLARGIDRQSALEAYQNKRRPRVSKVWHTARNNGRIYHLSGPMALARNQALKLYRPQQLLDRYAWIYRWTAEEL